MQVSQNINGFRQNNSQGLEIIKLYKQNKLENVITSTIYQNYTLALMSVDTEIYVIENISKKKITSRMAIYFQFFFTKFHFHNM